MWHSIFTLSWTAFLQFQASTEEFGWLEDQVDNGLSPCGEGELCQEQNIGHLSLPGGLSAPDACGSRYLKWPREYAVYVTYLSLFLTFIKAVRQALPQAALSSPWPFESGVYPCPRLPFSLPWPSIHRLTDWLAAQQNRYIHLVHEYVATFWPHTCALYTDC